MKRKIKINRRKTKARTTISSIPRLPLPICKIIFKKPPTNAFEAGDSVFWWDSGRNFNIDFQYSHKKFSLNPKARYIMQCKLRGRKKIMCYDKIRDPKGRLIAIFIQGQWVKPKLD